MRALRPSPVRTACLMQCSLITGSIPGNAASISETWELGSPPKPVDAPENSFDWEVTCACTSMPMTISHSPVKPLTRRGFLCVAVMALRDQLPGYEETFAPVNALAHEFGLAEGAMPDNGSSNGKLGAALGALLALALAVFLLSGGEHFGKKTVSSDA